MGGLLSRGVAWTTYEKSFERIANECKKIGERKIKRRKTVNAYSSSCSSLLALSAVLGVAHLAWVSIQLHVAVAHLQLVSMV